MGLRNELERKIEKKRQEIKELEFKIREAQAYISAHQETLKMLSREGSGLLAERNLRVGSSIAKARDAIKKAGKPLHIADLLKALGRPNDKKNRLSLSGSLAHYVRKGEIFSRPAPNTFGLTEFEHISGDSDDDSGEDSESINGNAALN